MKKKQAQNLVFCKPKPTLFHRSMPMTSCFPWLMMCLNLLPCLHLLPVNRPTRDLPACQFTPTNTFKHPHTRTLWLCACVCVLIHPYCIYILMCVYTFNIAFLFCDHLFPMSAGTCLKHPGPLLSCRRGIILAGVVALHHKWSILHLTNINVRLAWVWWGSG